MLSKFKKKAKKIYNFFISGKERNIIIGVVASMGLIITGLVLFLISRSLPAVIIIIFGVLGVSDLAHYREEIAGLDNLIEIIKKRK